MDRPLVLHDADCGFCTKCALLIPKLGARVTVSSIQREDLAALGVDADRARAEMPVVLPDGRIAWGHHAWAEILKACPQPLRLAGVLLDSRALERPASAAYAFIARHRDQLPGGTPACAMP